MKVGQKLKSGIMVRQDFRDAVRFVMFETDVEGWDYATHGGTMLIVNNGGRLYGVTCAHVRKDFPWRQLVVTDKKFGRRIAGLKAAYGLSQPSGDAQGSDVMDLAVVEFADDVGPGFFADNAYLFDPGTVGSSKSGERLLVNGAFKALSAIIDETIAPVFGLLEFEDCGPVPADPVLRLARAKFAGPEFDSLIGLSGSPVFNATKSCLAGIVVRGGMQGDLASIRYIDVTHLAAMMAAIANGTLSTNYRAIIPR